MQEFTITVDTLSPMHLASGKADIIIDSEIVHDRYGIPYFPAKRLKGLLYESALELAEMSNEKLITVAAIELVFGHGDSPRAQFTLSNLYVEEYKQRRKEWAYLEQTYAGLFNRVSVLDSYTDIRYQTAIDSANGVAAEGSLRNLRVVDAGLRFVGRLTLQTDEKEAADMLAWACKNIRHVGAKRNRGCGRVAITLQKSKGV